MKPHNHNLPFAKRSLGQNFLSDQRYIQRIIDAAKPEFGDLIIEIGPGRGAITESLVRSEADVLAVELDNDLIEPLRTRFSGNDNFRIVEGNILDLNLPQIIDDIYKQRTHLTRTKVVANLPYYISTAILQKLASDKDYFEALILMFQREVVDRITAKPGRSERGYLTVLVEASFDVEKLFDLPPEAFRPIPKVWSSVAKLSPKDTTIGDDERFSTLVSIGFSQKRKTLLNNLKGVIENAEDTLRNAGIDLKARAETLTLEQWRKLTESTKT